MKEREVKVNIFDMAGHPIFYEVCTCTIVHLISALCGVTFAKFYILLGKQCLSRSGSTGLDKQNFLT